MTPLRPVIAALVVIAAAAAGTGSTDGASQVRRARAKAVATLVEQPPHHLAASVADAAPKELIHANGTEGHVGGAGDGLKKRGVADWIGSFSALHRLHHGVIVAVNRGRALVGGAKHDATAMSSADEAAEEEDFLVTVLATLISMGTWVLLVGAVAYFYKSSYMSPPVDLEMAREQYKDQGFKHGPFECYEDMEIMCWSFFCLSIRWGDTMQATKLMTFPLAVGLAVAIGLLDAATGGVIIWIVAAAFFAYYRQELRKTLGMENSNEDKMKDFGMWCCCSCCAVAQEARHIRDAPKLDKEISEKAEKAEDIEA